MKFIADRTLGKLAKGLRMLGYDTLYYRGEDIHQLIHLAR
ncbi:MAG: Mut7-C RNAse domain-containing protein, partial [Deltaproteobacteria bacterium]|nr:Mut7-C RNAse domain-containing protein [Deltaproteobacteria bacterium]